MNESDLRILAQMGRTLIPAERSALGFAADEIPGGYTWTLTTWMGQLLTEAEVLFGKRDRSYTPLGVMFHGTRPHTWFPGACKHIAIVLTDDARDDPVRAFFQLAHEVVHLLGPNQRAGGSTVLEEGIATHFQDLICAKYGVPMHDSTSTYRHADALLRGLLSIDKHAVRKIRNRFPDLHRLDPKQLQKLIRKAPAELLSELCERFSALEYRLTGSSFHPAS